MDRGGEEMSRCLECRSGTVAATYKGQISVQCFQNLTDIQETPCGGFNPKVRQTGNAEQVIGLLKQLVKEQKETNRLLKEIEYHTRR